MNDRNISRIIPGMPSVDGDGVRIHRIGLMRQAEADPFLMLDELRSDDRKDFVGGFPPHPHRGMETLTVMLKGGLVHEDHLGNRGEIRAGGAQWMSAGRGIIHGEMPTLDTHGLHGFQLWINLPAAMKLKAPDYRDVHAEEIPAIADAFGNARIIAGHWQLDAHAIDGALMSIAAEAGVAELQLHALAGVAVRVPAAHSLSVYVFEGALAGPKPVTAGHLAVTDAGEALQLRAGADGARVLLLHGRPLREPIASYGPFVMNTQQQIEQAIDDYRSGRFAG